MKMSSVGFLQNSTDKIFSVFTLGHRIGHATYADNKLKFVCGFIVDVICNISKGDALWVIDVRYDLTDTQTNGFYWSFRERLTNKNMPETYQQFPMKPKMAVLTIHLVNFGQRNIDINLKSCILPPNKQEYILELHPVAFYLVFVRSGVIASVKGKDIMLKNGVFIVGWLMLVNKTTKFIETKKDV